MGVDFRKRSRGRSRIEKKTKDEIKSLDRPRPTHAVTIIVDTNRVVIKRSPQKPRKQATNFHESYTRSYAEFQATRLLILLFLSAIYKRRFVKRRRQFFLNEKFGYLVRLPVFVFFPVSPPFFHLLSSPEFYLSFPFSLPFCPLSTLYVQTQSAEISDNLDISTSILFTVTEGIILIFLW